MNILVNDSGFRPDDWRAGFDSIDDPWDTQDIALELPSDTPLQDLSALAERFDRIALIRIQFAGFADGRGFTLARHLRLIGFGGRLRASGHVIADQYAMARRCGFDEVEIDQGLAARQPECQWLARSAWRTGHYQGRLGMSHAGSQEERVPA